MMSGKRGLVDWSGLKRKKLLNRLFALIFTSIIVTWMVRFASSLIERGLVPATVHPFVFAIVMYSSGLVGYPLIVTGLLEEIRSPTLDFRLHRSKPWISTGIFLLGVFMLVNLVHAIWWSGDPDLFRHWVLDSLFMETSSFSLMFGILFMTRSTPRNSPSYRLMLIGAILFEIFCFGFIYLPAALGIPIGGDPYADFWGKTIFTLWFWWDFLSELVILVAGIWLLKMGKL